MARALAYNDFVQVGKQSAVGAVATSFLDLRARPWSFRNNPTRAFPEGERVGTRDMDSSASVPGRRWANGDLPTWWRSDTGGFMMLGALGSETVSAAPVGATIRKKHAIRCADDLPYLTVNNFMGAVVSAVKKAYQHLDCLVDRWRLTWDTTDDANLLAVTYSLLGKYGTPINKPTFVGTAWTALPGWDVTATINSVASTRVRQLDCTFENNVARVKAGVGSRDDQDEQPGGRRFSGTMTMIYEDETEYTKFENAGVDNIVISFKDTVIVETVTAVDYFGGIDILIPNFTHMEYNREEVDGYYVQRLGFRGFHDATLGGPVGIDVYNSSAAY